MASDGNPVKIPATSPVHGSQAPTTVVLKTAGTSLPPSSSAAANPAVVKAQAASKASEQSHTAAPQALVSFLNKYLNDSGRPDQFRVDPTSEENIQEVNPATGAVIAEYSASEFPALARSVGVTRGLVDSHA
jgi:hypothetical protein